MSNYNYESKTDPTSIEVPEEYQTGNLPAVEEEQDTEVSGVELPLLDQILAGKSVLEGGPTGRVKLGLGYESSRVDAPKDPNKEIVFTQTQEYRGMTDKQRQQARDDQAYADDLTRWWCQLTEDDIKRTVPKAIEYGSHDLDIMIMPMLALAGDTWDEVPDDERAVIGREMSVLFYLQGKIGRAISAYKRGMRPSADTVLDIRVYSVMLQRIFETGKW